MPFYQEDWRYGNDSHYGLSSTTRFSDPIRMPRRRHARYAGDSGLTEDGSRGYEAKDYTRKEGCRVQLLH
jgi:hypothetical protein